MVSLYTAGTPAFTNYSPGAGLEVGARFVTANDLSVTALRWYRADTNAAHKPEALRIWDHTTHAIVVSAPSIPDNGSVGWQEVAISPAVTIPSGHDYLVTGYIPDTGGHGTYAIGTVPGPDSPLNWGASYRGYRSTGIGEPVSFDSVNLEGFDLVADDLGPGAGSGSGTLTGDLNSWLNTNAPPNVHTDDGLPWRTDATATATKTELDAVQAQQNEWAYGLAGAAHGYFATVQSAINAIKAVTDTLPGPIADLTSIVLDHYTADIASILAQIDSVLAGQAVARGTVPVPGTGWTLTDETDWTDELAWAVPADLYVLTITGTPAGVAADSYAGVTWYHRLGSWAPLNGSQIAGERGFVEFSPQELQQNGRTMPGLALKCRTGTTGHVQAWVLS